MLALDSASTRAFYSPAIIFTGNLFSTPPSIEMGHMGTHRHQTPIARTDSPTARQEHTYVWGIALLRTKSIGSLGCGGAIFALRRIGGSGITSIFLTLSWAALQYFSL